MGDLNEINDLQPREYWTAVPFPPPTSRPNSLSASASRRDLPLFSRVVVGGLFTSKLASNPKSTLSKPILSEPIHFGVLVNSSRVMISYHISGVSSPGFGIWAWSATGSGNDPDMSRRPHSDLSGCRRVEGTLNDGTHDVLMCGRTELFVGYNAIRWIDPTVRSATRSRSHSPNEAAGAARVSRPAHLYRCQP